MPETLVILYLVPHFLMCGRALALHIDVLKHAVDRLAKNWRKDIKLLDTKLTVSRELTQTCMSEAEFSHLFHVA